MVVAFLIITLGTPREVNAAQLISILVFVIDFIILAITIWSDVRTSHCLKKSADYDKALHHLLE